jgi:hypothetical protein
MAALGRKRTFDHASQQSGAGRHDQFCAMAAELANMRQGERTDLSPIDPRLSQPEVATSFGVYFVVDADRAEKGNRRPTLLEAGGAAGYCYLSVKVLFLFDPSSKLLLFALA